MVSKKWKVWHYLGIKKEELLDEVDQVETTDALLDFFEDLHYYEKELPPLLKDLQELERERTALRKDLLGTNFEAQAKQFDALLDKYASLEDDIAINGIRIRRMAQAFLERAKEAGFKELANRKEKEPVWQEF